MKVRKDGISFGMYLWIVGTILLLVVGVYQVARPKPDPLVFVVLPAEVEELTAEQFAPLVDYLSAGLGREVELMTVADYNAVVVAMEYGHADFARISPGAYIGAVDDLGLDIELLAVAVKEVTGAPSYSTYIITLADSGITDLNGTSFAFVDIGSTSGHLIPSVYVLENDIEFSEEFYAGSHGAVIEAIKNGTVDAGAVASNRYQTALEEGVIDEDTLEIFWESAPIPNAPIVVQSSMDLELKATLQTLFLDAPRSIVEALDIGEIGYVIISDADYDPLRAAKALKE